MEVSLSNYTKYRIEYFDILKGIGMIFLVWGHTGLVPDIIAAYYQSFYMPLFFLVSGYFYKKRNWNVLFKDLTEKLVVPYFFATLSFFVLSLFIDRGGTPSV